MAADTPIVNGDGDVPVRAKPVVDEYARPAKSVAAVTPNDSTDLPGGVCNALFIGVFGDVEVIAEDDSTEQVFKNHQGVLPVRASRVLASNTTATNILALY